MNQDAMRIAIAEACPKLLQYRNGEVQWRYGFEGEDSRADVLNDLNAMHAAVETLDEKQFAVFCWTLADMLEAFDWDRSNEDLRKVMEASALQRAEAFLRTVGKWEVK
jgi:hypothetical protein